MEIVEDMVDAIVAFECPEDISGVVKTTCAAAENVFYLIFKVILTYLKVVGVYLWTCLQRFLF